MVNFDDKRNFYRMMLNSEVTVTVIDAEANSTVLATCRDLSATGMAIEMDQPLEINTAIKVNLESANKSVPALNMNGKVVRVNEEGADCYLVGVNFCEID